MSIARTYAEFCADLSYGDLPPAVVDDAKRLVLDTVGIAVGALPRAESSDAIVAGARALDGGAEGATVLATGERMAPQYAAFLNGALAHSLDYDDTHRASSLHPGAPVIPAALAAAERAGASGEELLAGIVAGYEVVTRLGMAVDAASHYGRGFHGTATCGTFGATAAAGSILGLSADELEAAFGVNGSQASGSLQFLENGGWNKRVHPGFAARSGVEAVALAEAGFHAASSPIEGERGFLTGYTDDPAPELATRELGETYEIRNTAIKPYPCCRYMHGPLDLLLELVESADLAPSDVERVTIDLPSTGAGIVGGDAGTYPASFVDAQFDMRFGAALAITERDAGVDSFVETVSREYTGEFERLYDATVLESSDEVDDLYPEKWAARVAVDTAADRYEGYTEHARGEPENPLSEAAVRGKFDELVSGAPASVREDAADRILRMGAYDVEELLAPFARAHGRSTPSR